MIALNLVLLELKQENVPTYGKGNEGRKCKTLADESMHQVNVIKLMYNNN